MEVVAARKIASKVLGQNGKLTALSPGCEILSTAMPIHVGIQCESCGRVYFVANTDRIEFQPSEFYQLTCTSPCNAVRTFLASDMKPYSVSTYSYQRGYAGAGEYQELRQTG